MDFKVQSDEAQKGFAALRAGQSQKARAHFDAAVRWMPNDASAWLGLAVACRSLGDQAAKLAAVEKVLELQPTDLGALLMKADHLAAEDKIRTAAAFYQAVVRTAPPSAQRSPKMQREIQRAQTLYERYSARYEQHLRDNLAEKGFDLADPQSRVGQSLDILFGHQKIYTQEPHQFYFPELPQIQFYDRADFDWVPAMEAATADIRLEAEALLADQAAFEPYLHAGTASPRLRETELLNNADWGAGYLIRDGRIVEKNARRCPKAMAALMRCPLARINGKAPMALFSLLRPHTKIPSHNGLLNTRLICHLPLVIPPLCHIRVGNQNRQWREGEMLIFDDSIEHEAENGSDQLRIVLLFEIWRPELSAEERAFVSAMFEAIESFPSGAA